MHIYIYLGTTLAQVLGLVESTGFWSTMQWKVSFVNLSLLHDSVPGNMVYCLLYDEHQ